MIREGKSWSPISCAVLVGAIGLLFVLSVVVFSIFYLVPRLAGATPETFATRYVGRAATEQTVTLTAANKLGFYDPLPVQYWQLVKGLFVGADYDYGAGVERCPAPCLGYSFITKQPVWPEVLDRMPVTVVPGLRSGRASGWSSVSASACCPPCAAGRSSIGPR